MKNCYFGLTLVAKKGFVFFNRKKDAIVILRKEDTTVKFAFLNRNWNYELRSFWSRVVFECPRLDFNLCFV